jgi:predicted AAA+ superfamily ATPase
VEEWRPNHYILDIFQLKLEFCLVLPYTRAVIKRDISRTILAEATQYPVLTLIGPRQSGKTTLVRDLFSEHRYVNLENPEYRNLAEIDPKAFFHRFPAPVILDEVQRVPQLLSWIQVMVDEANHLALQSGQPAPTASFVLTGSHQLELRAQITQSLAGRTSLLSLYPFSMQEIPMQEREQEEWILNGFFPAIYSQKIEPGVFYRNYYRTYVEKDVRLLINLKDSRAFEQFLKLLAGRIGQELNLQSISKQIGVSSTTLAKWISILEASFIITLIPPYYENFGKRVVKSPKLYFVDIGLACWLLGIETAQQVFRDPLAGSLFENLVVLEVMKRQLNHQQPARLYFWRDHNQNEVDLIIEHQRDLIPIEIKSSRTWHRDFSRGIRYFQKITARAPQGYVLYGGTETLVFETFRVLPYTDLMPWEDKASDFIDKRS